MNHSFLFVILNLDIADAEKQMRLLKMQKVYANLFNLIKLRKKVSYILIVISIALIFGILFFDRNLGEAHTDIRELSIAIIIMFLAAVSVVKETDQIRWNRIIYYPFVLFGIGIIAISCIHKTGLLILAIELIILLPGLYYIWINRGDIRLLYDIIAETIIIEGFITFLYCFVLSLQAKAFIVNNRYAGFAAGPNQLGEMGTAIFIAGLYILITYKKDSFATCILSSTGIAVGICYVLLSACRTAMVADFVSLLAAVIYAIKLERSESVLRMDCVLQLAFTVILTAIIIFAGMQLDNIQFSQAQKSDAVPSSRSDDYSVALVVLDSYGRSENTVSVSSITTTAGVDAVKTKYTEDENSVSITDRFKYKGDINALSANRVSLWLLYIDNLSAWGNDDYYELGKDNSDKLYLYPAHNNVIEYTYRCGYLVGFVYLILYIAIGIEGLKLLFGRKHIEPYLVFCIMCIGAFSVYALIEWSHILVRPMTVMYYLSLAPVFTSPYQGSSPQSPQV